MMRWLSRFLSGRRQHPAMGQRLPKQLNLLTCQIHGSHYYDCLHLVRAGKVHKGDRLILKREPSNEYDVFAIEVFNAKHIKMGYVPKNHNRVIAELMDQQCLIYAVVESVESEAWEPVNIRLILQTLD